MELGAGVEITLKKKKVNIVWAYYVPGTVHLINSFSSRNNQKDRNTISIVQIKGLRFRK